MYIHISNQGKRLRQSRGTRVIHTQTQGTRVHTRSDTRKKETRKELGRLTTTTGRTPHPGNIWSWYWNTTRGDRIPINSLRTILSIPHTRTDTLFLTIRFLTSGILDRADRLPHHLVLMQLRCLSPYQQTS
jgi:hypothetical protein